MKIDPNEPAMPQMGEVTNYTGLTIRAEIASRIMAGLIASPATFTCDETRCTNESDYALLAVRFADALISELNKEN